MSMTPKITHDPSDPRAVSGHDSLPLIAIVGPTASGKSSLAVALARKLGGDVLACDSTQVYRGFDIGTAKPTMEERDGVPHHLLDLVAPSFPFTAGEYRTRAAAVLQDLRQRSRLPILTVGTGLYLRALIEGLADAPARSEELRARLEAGADMRSLQYLHRVLRRLDPEAALRIGSRDRPKMIRAIEVCLLTGRPLSEVHRSGRTPLKGYHPIKIGLQPPRAALYQRIERRVQTMLDRGWLDEVSRAGSERRSTRFKTVRFYRVQRIAGAPRGHGYLSRCDQGHRAIHPPLRQTPGYLVPQRAAGALAPRLRRRSHNYCRCRKVCDGTRAVHRRRLAWISRDR